MLACWLLGLAGEVAQDLHRACRFADALLERLPFLTRQLPADLRNARLQDVGGFVEDIGADNRGTESPQLIRLVGCRNRRVDLLRPRCCKVPNEIVTVGRTAIFKRGAASRRAPLAADEIAKRLRCLRRLCPGE